MLAHIRPVKSGREAYRTTVEIDSELQTKKKPGVAKESKKIALYTGDPFAVASFDSNAISIHGRNLNDLLWEECVIKAALTEKVSTGFSASRPKPPASSNTGIESSPAQEKSAAEEKTGTSVHEFSSK